ncbi:MAG: ABC-F family ATP-binding cassette domain-containing protein [Planctomycetota bacterium]|nr:ABC-F family ATP-binding cassette domain-containing protein [Planctomycetota bacterium]
MALITANGLRMHFGGPLLLDGVNVKVEPGARIGLIGRNGTGKSTLLKLLAGRLEPTDGSVARQSGARVAYQAQELLFEPGRTVFQEMQRAFEAETARERELRNLEQALATEQDEQTRGRLLREYEALQAEQEQAGVYDVDRRIESVLSSLGLPESAWHQPMDGFSGGERNVIGLARALLGDPDVLLLDEPTNHLDMEGVEWFIDFVRKSKAAILMVSHNRHLLDAVGKEIWELRGARVTPWTGNYSDFQRQKAEALARQERQYKAQQRLIARIEFQARRLRDMANAYDDPAQAKRAKSMLKRIERMDKVERPDDKDRTFGASMSGGNRHGRIALSVKDFSFAYGERVLFDKACLEIEFGDRVCLVGSNGSGKSTLFHEILEHGGWDNHTLRLGKSVKVGDYSQLRENLDPAETLEDWAVRTTRLPPKQAVLLLHRFLFTREDLPRPIGSLSGGEKSRLQLARLVHEKVNFLMLDEPTNHLDIQACEQLEEMLQDFEGTLFVISHDRYFLDKLVDRVVEVKDRQLVDHPMRFAPWWRQKVDSGEFGRHTALRDRHTEAEGKQDARKAFEDRRTRQRELNRLRNRYRDLEARITELEDRIRDMEQRLEGAYAPGHDPAQAEALLGDLQSGRTELQKLYEDWETVAAALED